MHFSLKNIGIIKEADIALNGLTVLAGCNDIGKSFIGRTIFSVIKAISQSEEQFYFVKMEQIEEQIDKIYVLLRDVPQVRRLSFGNFLTEIRRKIISLGFPFPESEVDEILEDLVNKIIEYTKEETQRSEGFENFQDILKKNISELKKIILEGYDRQKIITSFFNGFIRNEFQDQINFKEEKAFINCYQQQIKFLDIEIQNNKTACIDLYEPLFFDNATLIESPLVLQLANFITSNLAFGRSPYYFSRRNILGRRDLPGHYIELVQKIRNADLNIDVHKDIRNLISKIINGNIIYDKKADNFYFLRNDGLLVKQINTAHGVKTFGLIQLLLSSGALNSKSVLIIDEPEVHLHPEWQRLYAKLIVDLVRMDIPVLVSSHSPYMIKAFEVYSEKYNVKDKTKFYFGSRTEDNRVNYLDVSNNLEPIYKKLAVPMQEISFDS